MGHMTYFLHFFRDFAKGRVAPEVHLEIEVSSTIISSCKDARHKWLYCARNCSTIRLNSLGHSRGVMCPQLERTRSSE